MSLFGACVPTGPQANASRIGESTRAMNKLSGNGQTGRAGPEFRLNASRYFHVMGEGWYLHTREGVEGPFLQRADAQRWLENKVLTLTDRVRDKARRIDSDPWSQSRR